MSRRCQLEWTQHSAGPCGRACSPQQQQQRCAGQCTKLRADLTATVSQPDHPVCPAFWNSASLDCTAQESTGTRVRSSLLLTGTGGHLPRPFAARPEGVCDGCEFLEVNGAVVVHVKHAESHPHLLHVGCMGSGSDRLSSLVEGTTWHCEWSRPAITHLCLSCWVEHREGPLRCRLPAAILVPQVEWRGR